MDKYYVYILYSAKLNRYYIGQTQDIEERLRKHHFSKDHFTGKSDDWELKYTEEYSSRSEAIARESSIKAKKSRKYIEFLIQNRAAGE
ncbi:MAG: GIY-YIG nuclease family protein [Weeksellaceae bacterium]|nr:GIY-YIG nuclease family protein [Bacteroidota bacterium]MCG2780878.1 GIY-YIG nuclease family protein [Weeksellaceae bacterium]